MQVTTSISAVYGQGLGEPSLVPATPLTTPEALDSLRVMERIAQALLLSLIAGAVVAACASQQESPQDRLGLIYPEERPFAESRFTTIAELSMHYRVWQPEGVPIGKILLLHGLGGSTYSFDHIVPLLVAEGYAIAAIDLPGFGYSDPALKLEHTPQNRLGLVWTLIDRLDTDDNQLPVSEISTQSNAGPPGSPLSIQR